MTSPSLDRKQALPTLGTAYRAVLALHEGAHGDVPQAAKDHLERALAALRNAAAAIILAPPLEPDSFDAVARLATKAGVLPQRLIALLLERELRSPAPGGQ